RINTQLRSSQPSTGRDPTTGAGPITVAGTTTCAGWRAGVGPRAGAERGTATRLAERPGALRNRESCVSRASAVGRLVAVAGRAGGPGVPAEQAVRGLLLEDLRRVQRVHLSHDGDRHVGGAGAAVLRDQVNRARVPV